MASFPFLGLEFFGLRKISPSCHFFRFKSLFLRHPSSLSFPFLGGPLYRRFFPRIKMTVFFLMLHNPLVDGNRLPPMNSIMFVSFISRNLSLLEHFLQEGVLRPSNVIASPPPFSLRSLFSLGSRTSFFPGPFSFPKWKCLLGDSFLCLLCASPLLPASFY